MSAFFAALATIGEFLKLLKALFGLGVKIVKDKKQANFNRAIDGVKKAETTDEKKAAVRALADTLK